MRTRVTLRFLLLIAMGAAAGDARLIAQDKKDYLSDVEADKIRDAQTPSLRIKLFISYAQDRLRKFQYELGKTTAESRRSDTLNGLLNAYSGCVDDAADVINLGTEKQQDVRDAVKEMQTKGKEFLETLEKISKDGRDLDLYRDTLEDAIEGTRDALKDADKAAKQSSPPPVRRKPS